MVAKVKIGFTSFIILFYIFLTLPQTAKSIDIIRDTELENFTNEIISILLNDYDLSSEELNIYFIKSDEINAFVTAGKNMFINTEIIVKSEDYREYAAVIAHELSHILGGHIFNTQIEISNLSTKALPVYLLGIIGIISGSTDSGIAGVMVGQASIADGFTYYSRTQEASADQAAVKILCNSGISANFLITFLQKLEAKGGGMNSNSQNYRSTHPSIDNRITLINSALVNNDKCEFRKDYLLDKKFKLLKAKLHGFTHPFDETNAVYNSKNDIDLYATAVSNYFQGQHKKSIENLKILLARDSTNPYYNELLGEIYFANNDYSNAATYQLNAISYVESINDLYYMMLGNYLLSINDFSKVNESIYYLKKSLQINSQNAYSWYLLARAYAQVDKLPLANYATAERYFLIGERKLSYDFALKAIKNIEENTPEWYRSIDLIEILKKEVLKNQ